MRESGGDLSNSSGARTGDLSRSAQPLVKRLLSAPWVYVAWLIVLVASLFAAYATDPYVFGFAVFGLGAATGVICIAGCCFAVMNPGTSRRGRLTVLMALLLAVAAVLRAVAILGAFKWA